MKAKKWTFGTVGTVSEATMRPEDLIPAFCSELRTLGHRSRLLSQIERAESSASISSLYKIASALRLRMAELFGGS